MFYQCYVLPMLCSIQSTVGLIAPCLVFHGTFLCQQLWQGQPAAHLAKFFCGKNAKASKEAAPKKDGSGRRVHWKKVRVFFVLCCLLFVVYSLFFVPGVIHSFTSFLVYRLCNLIEVVDTLHRQPQPVSDAAARSKGVVVWWGGWFGARDFRVCHGLVCQWWC